MENYTCRECGEEIIGRENRFSLESGENACEECSRREEDQDWERIDAETDTD